MEAIPVMCTKRLLILHVCVRMTPLVIGPEGAGWAAATPAGHA